MIDSEIIDDNSDNIVVEQDKSRLYRIIALFLILVCFVVLSVFADNWMNNRTISRVKVYGCSMASSSDIALMIQDSVIDKKIMNVNTEKIEKIVKENPYVASVSFNALFNGEFQVIIKEREPIAITVDNSGNIAYSDSKGYVFPYAFDSGYEDLPVIRGNIDSREFASTARLLRRIIDLDEADYEGMISEILPGRGKYTFEIISSDYGYRLILDSQTPLDEQLSKYFTFLSSSLCGNDKVKIDYLDLRWEKRIVIGKSA